MIDYVGMLREFHEAFGHHIAKKPEIIASDEIAILRVDLINEEAAEFESATRDENLVEIADALADLLYVVFGAALVYGIPIEDVFTEVHRSNMSKLGADGKPIYRIDGKVLKGPNYSPPDIASILK